MSAVRLKQLPNPARRRATTTGGTWVAYWAGMIDVALSILALIAGGLTLELFAAAWPPLGYHEQRRFNFRNETLDTVEELQIGNPS